MLSEVLHCVVSPLPPVAVTMPDPVWEYATVCSDRKRAVCSWCKKEKTANVTYLKRHMLSSACSAPDDVKLKLSTCLLKGQHKESTSTERLRGMKRTLEQTDDEDDGNGTSGCKRPCPEARGGAQSSVDNWVSVMSEQDRARADELCARWIYRDSMSFRTTESSDLRRFLRVLNPAYKLPSRRSLSSTLLDREYEAQAAVVEPLVHKSMKKGDLLVGGDCWTDASLTSINNIVLFTPSPLYIETAVWPEERQTAHNTAAFYIKRIEALGPRNVFAFVSDTESKMQAVWALLVEKYPWLQVLPCASHCLDLLLADLSKNPLLAKGLLFCNAMTQFWRHHSLPKQILERCQVAEYKAVRQLQRPGSTRWKSQVTAAKSLLLTQAAMEKAAVDTAFREQCLRSPATAQRDAAKEAVKQIQDEQNWEALELVKTLLEPVAISLDVGQVNTGGLGMVMRSFFLMSKHFVTFKYPSTDEGRRLKSHCLSSLEQRRTYLLRPIHTLAYLLDPRFCQAVDQPSQQEVAAAVDLMLNLAAAHDTRLALVRANEDDPSKLPEDYPRTTVDNIIGEYTDFRSRTGGSFLMDAAWGKSAVRNPLSWWQSWAGHLPALLSIAQKVMKLPLSFAAGERSFSNAGHIQGKLRTRLSHHRLHQLLYVYFNSRILKDLPVSCTRTGIVPEAPAITAAESGDLVDAAASDEEDGLNLAAATSAIASIVDEN